MSRAQLTSTVEQNSAGAAAPYVAGKNKLINGDFGIWQRGTSFTNLSNAYACDRWLLNNSVASTVAQQSSGAPLGSRYYSRITFGASGILNFNQFLETSTVAMLWGQTVTFSVKLRRNSTLAANMSVIIAKSSTVDANVFSTWTTINTSTVVYTNLPTATTSSDWYLATVSAFIPNDGTANGLYVGIASGTQASGATYDVAEAQLEAGSVATPFTTASGTLQGELALCQRYYYRQNSSATFMRLGNGVFTSTTNLSATISLPVTMRTATTTIGYSNLGTFDGVNILAVSASAVNAASTTCPSLDFTVSGATQYRPGQPIINNNANGYLALDCEL